MHIKSQAAVDALLFMCKEFGEPAPPNAVPSLGSEAVAVLDQVGANRGVLLSQAYFFGSPWVESLHYDVARMTRAENDYVAEQVSKRPERLVGFFSVNPLSSNALDEIAHWSRDGRLKGLKLHLANSRVDFKDPEHVRRMAAVVGLAGKAKLPMVVHLSTSSKFTAEETEIYVRDVLPHAGESWSQMAHGAGFGGTDKAPLEAMRVFEAHIAKNDPATQHVVFDLSEVVTANTSDQDAKDFVAIMRNVGLNRFLTGCDWDLNQLNESDELLRQKLPLSQEEWHAVARNCAPWASQN